MPLSNLTQMVSRGMKTYGKSRKELQNLQILKKCWKSQVSFCYQSSLVSRKCDEDPYLTVEAS